MRILRNMALLVVMLMGVMLMGVNVAEGRSPNVVFFLVDDLGWMDVGKSVV